LELALNVVYVQNNHKNCQELINNALKIIFSEKKNFISFNGFFFFFVLNVIIIFFFLIIKNSYREFLIVKKF